MSRPLAEIAVIIPARDEEDSIAACLDAIGRARAALAARTGSISVRTVVVLDACRDATADIVARYRVDVVPISSGRVGAARAAGAARVVAAFESQSAAPREPDQLWLACTDADSRVPVDWLITHARAARRGVDLLLGTVRPDPRDLEPELLAAWSARHLLGNGHPHVHGANLGIRASTYVAVGGFPDVRVHEDALLMAAVRAGGGVVVATGASPVVTSGRAVGRVTAGFAGYLRGLARTVPSRAGLAVVD